MPKEFGPEDVERLKELLHLHPQGGALLSGLSEMMIVQDLARTLKYPINSFTELVAQLGRDRVLKFGNDEIKAEELRAKIPAYYFPIGSHEDFMHKAAELMKNRQTIRIEGGKPELPEGGLMPAHMAPPMDAEVLRLKAPATMPPGGGIGYTKEEADKLLARGGPA